MAKTETETSTEFPQKLYKGDQTRLAHNQADVVKLTFDGYRTTKVEGKEAAEKGDSTDTQARRTPTADSTAQKAAAGARNAS